MEYPTYNKTDLEWANANADHDLVEFDEYIQYLRTSDLLSHDTAIAIVNIVAQQGTAVLSPAQRNALSITIGQFPIAHCIRCGCVMAVKADEAPGLCDNCKELIESQ
jgi:hypothetical protein